jgi:hypothetical protein
MKKLARSTQTETVEELRRASLACHPLDLGGSHE